MPKSGCFPPIPPPTTSKKPSFRSPAPLRAGTFFAPFSGSLQPAGIRRSRRRTASGNPRPFGGAGWAFRRRNVRGSAALSPPSFPFLRPRPTQKFPQIPAYSPAKFFAPLFPPKPLFSSSFARKTFIFRGIFASRAMGAYPGARTRAVCVFFPVFLPPAV